MAHSDPSKKHRVFITGTAGFIGFHLAKLLLKEGHIVCGMDGMTDYYDVTLKQRRHQMLLQNPNFQAHELRLEEADAVTALITGFAPTSIVHLAGQAGVRYSLENPRAYLDSNCGHCHNPNGPADTSALDLSHANQSPESLGVCKPPIAAGRGSGGHLYGIVPGDPDASILIHRLTSTELRSRMPEVGRSLEHTEGVHLVRSWVASMSGECR